MRKSVLGGTVMQTVQVRLTNAQIIEEFVREVSKINTDIDMVHDRYVIDAKSILGILTMNLAKPLQLNIHSDDKSIVSGIARFMI